MRITERQQRILKAIISEFMESCGPVGSGNLVKKYDIPASPATVRYEMAALSAEGLVEKPHRSAGRVPTITGLRYYLADLFEEKVVDYLLEMEVKQRQSKVKFDRELLLREAVSILAEKSGHLGFCVMNDGPRVGGITNLLELEKGPLSIVFAMLEDDKMFKDVLAKSQDIKTGVLLGDETGLAGLENISVVYSKVNLYGDSGWFGVLGPIWMDYRVIMPLVSLVSETAEAESADWGKKEES